MKSRLEWARRRPSRSAQLVPATAELLDVNSILELKIHSADQQKLCTTKTHPASSAPLSLGNAMENRGVPTVSKSRSVKQRGGAPRQRGDRSGFAVAFWAAASVLLLAGLAGLVVLFTPAVSANKDAVAAADPYRLATIVRDDGRTRCVHATFDNITGSISEKPAVCESTAITDGAGAPAALGTMHTLNAISNSFRK